MRSAGRVLILTMAIQSPVATISAADGAWISLAPMPDPRQEVGVAELNGKIYVVGGLPRTNRVQQYDPATSSWKSVAPLPIDGGVDHTAAASVGGKLYVMGGNTSSGPTSALFEYDPARDQWTRRASMPTARNALAAAVMGAKIYAVGGAGATERELEVYDPATDSWLSRAPMPTGRNHLAAGAIKGKLYVAGGRTGGDFRLSVLEVYDPATDSWATKARIPTGRSGHAGAVVRDKFYTFGGEGNPNTPTGVFQEVEMYDPETDIWKLLDPMPTPRHGVGAASIGNRILVPAGATRAGGGSQTGTNEAFVVQPENLYFAHFGVGQGISSEITLANASESQDAVATVELRDQGGNPLAVNLDGAVRSKVTSAVPPAGSVALRASDAGVLKIGTVTVSSDAPLSGLVFLADSISGLDSSPPSTRFFFPVQRDTVTGINTGIAIANTTDGPVNVNLILRNDKGAEFARRQVTLGPRGQIAEVLERLFSVGPDVALINFRGTITGTSTGAVAVLGLLFKGTNFTTLPVSGQ